MTHATPRPNRPAPKSHPEIGVRGRVERPDRSDADAGDMPDAHPAMPRHPFVREAEPQLHRPGRQRDDAAGDGSSSQPRRGAYSGGPYEDDRNACGTATAPTNTTAASAAIDRSAVAPRREARRGQGCRELRLPCVPGRILHVTADHAEPDHESDLKVRPYEYRCYEYRCDEAPFHDEIARAASR